MNTPGPAPSDSDLLQSFLCGDLDPQSPEGQRWLASRPHLAQQMNDLQAVVGKLDDLNADADEIIAEAQQSTSAADRAFARQHLSGLPLQGQSIPSKPGQLLQGPWVRRFSTLAAAAVILILAIQWWPTKDAPGGSGMLSGGQATAESAQEVESFAKLAFQGDLQPFETLLISVRDGASGALLFEDNTEINGLTPKAEANWSPNTDQLDAMEQAEWIQVEWWVKGAEQPLSLERLRLKR